MLEKNGDISVNYGGVILCWYFLVDFLLSVFEVLIAREDGLKKKKRLEGEEDLKFCKPSSFSSELSRSSLVCLCTDWTAYKPAWWSVYSSLRGREISASLLKVLPFSAVVQNSGCPFLASTAGRHCLQRVFSWAEPQQ